MASNLLWANITPGIFDSFTIVLVILSICTWTKLLIKIQMTERFGPMFKVIMSMMTDLVGFYALWSIILMALTSVACLIFIDLPYYENFWAALYMHFEFALGNFDSGIYCEEDEDGGAEAAHRRLAAESYDKDENGPAWLALFDACLIGKLYMFIFNSANLVLLLNLIIAILSSTYAFYEDKKIGLYYEVLVSRFSIMEFDERFGSCALA